MIESRKIYKGVLQMVETKEIEDALAKNKKGIPDKLLAQLHLQ